MRGTLMRLWTEQQHKEILAEFPDNVAAAAEYSARLGKTVTRQNVLYWRKIFVEDGSMAAADRTLKEARQLRTPSPNEDIGQLPNVPPEARRILVIPDIHAPYQHKDTLRFLQEVKNTVDPDLVVCLGDEADYHALSFHDSDPNLDSAGVELEKAKAFLRELHAVFPQMLICHSNHGSMVYRRGKAHGIPVQVIKTYRDILLPGLDNSGWSWAESWTIDTNAGPIMFKHQAAGDIVADAAHNQCNLVVGHSHGQFSVQYAASKASLYFGCYSGCLIDNDSYAFAYGRNSRNKPILGVTVILDGRPTLVPMALDSKGDWKQ